MLSNQRAVTPLTKLQVHNHTMAKQRTEVISGHFKFFASIPKVKMFLQNFNSIKNQRIFLCHFKMTGRACTDKVQEKVTSFQKVTLFCVI